MLDTPHETTSHHSAEAPTDLAQWGLHGFCLGARSTPHAVVGLDDNGEILYHARNGITFDELAALGISPTESQLKLLQLYSVLDVEGEHLRSTFPIVEPVKLAAVRAGSKALAAEVAPAIMDDVGAICTQLRNDGHTGLEYTVIFGHVIDGLFWEDLKAAQLVPTSELSVEKPLWNGLFWAIHPARPGTAGINDERVAGGTLVAMWTHATARTLVDFTRKADITQLRKRGLLVIDPKQDTAIEQHSERISRTLTTAIRSDTALAILELLEGTTTAEATVIVGHEWIWDLMNELEAAGVLVRPASLDNPQPTEGDLLKQMFLRLE
ncbi:hypothetical protein [Natronoglycomyces albus]|uniref:Uncharacterized protein n=1 Tax=Natronoglycomyces albus TaxID=2811108 RepID=A0A895XYL9_9ACTN|nr:hypothetical protein [Natronoglycomyces albus]QSB06708.1 hypothetical protein JQS30_07390 [Natronoglycomyces albus]